MSSPYLEDFNNIEESDIIYYCPRGGIADCGEFSTVQEVEQHFETCTFHKCTAKGCHWMSNKTERDGHMIMTHRNTPSPCYKCEHADCDETFERRIDWEFHQLDCDERVVQYRNCIPAEDPDSEYEYWAAGRIHRPIRRLIWSQFDPTLYADLENFRFPAPEDIEKARQVTSLGLLLPPVEAVANVLASPPSSPDSSHKRRNPFDSQSIAKRKKKHSGIKILCSQALE